MTMQQILAEPPRSKRPDDHILQCAMTRHEVTTFKPIGFYASRILRRLLTGHERLAA